LHGQSHITSGIAGLPAQESTDRHTCMLESMQLHSSHMCVLHVWACASLHTTAMCATCWPPHAPTVMTNDL
jgi:hypothetical protein